MRPGTGSTISNAQKKITAITKPHLSHEEAAIASLKRDPEFAVGYLNAVLADGERGEQLLVLRRMAEAFGGIAALAGKANLNPKTLYRTRHISGVDGQ